MRIDFRNLTVHYHGGDVADFAANWPGCRLKGPVGFGFDSRGNLIETDAPDCPEAVALSQDAAIALFGPTGRPAATEGGAS